MSADFDAIRHTLSIARDRGFAEVVLESGDLKFKAALELKGRPKPALRTSAVGEADPAPPTAVPVMSTMVGYFRAADVPVVEGDKVTAGQVIGIVSSLGDIPYAIEAPTEGTVTKVLVEAGAPVMYGQTLMEIEP